MFDLNQFFADFIYRYECLPQGEQTLLDCGLLALVRKLECHLWVATSTGRCNVLFSNYREGDVVNEAKAEDLLFRISEGLVWDRWQKGDSLATIGHLFDRGHSSVGRILSETGGIRPARRRRSRLALRLSEREEVSRVIVAGHSIRSIAASLGRSPSTVSREINGNGGRRRYRASQAEQATWDRARRPKRCKLVENRALAGIVASKLKLHWSPDQVAGWPARPVRAGVSVPGLWPAVLAGQSLRQAGQSGE